MTTLQVLATGLATTQDLGRTGLAHLGVSRSGAADRRAHALANRLVANPPDRATVEITNGGFAARVCDGPALIAVTGAAAQPFVDGIPFGLNSIRHVHPGQVVSLGVPAAGLRSYIAVRGGVDASPVLGSRSYDTLARIGPPPLRPGDTVSVGPRPAGFGAVDLAPVAAAPAGTVELRVLPGPRADWFVDPDAVVGTEWTVSEHSDRVGVRLIGPALRHRQPDRQLPSEGTTRGAIQVPPNGQPAILGPDHPVTGGYPVIGVLTAADCDTVSQVRPGQRVRLRWI